MRWFGFLQSGTSGDDLPGDAADTLAGRILSQLSAFVTIIVALSASILLVLLVTYSDGRGSWPRGESLISTANLPTTLAGCYVLLGSIGIAASVLQWKRPSPHTTTRGRILAYVVAFVALALVLNMMVLVSAIVGASGIPKESFRWFSP